MSVLVEINPLSPSQSAFATFTYLHFWTTKFFQNSAPRWLFFSLWKSDLNWPLLNGNSLFPKSVCLFSMGCNLCYSWVNMNKLLECPASTGWNTKLLQRPPSQTAAVPGFGFIFLGAMQAGTHFLPWPGKVFWEWSGEAVPGCCWQVRRCSSEHSGELMAAEAQRP